MKPSFFSYMHENAMKQFLADPYREMWVSKGRLRQGGEIEAFSCRGAMTCVPFRGVHLETV